MTDSLVSALELDNSIHRNPNLSCTTRLILWEILDCLEKGTRVSQRKIAEILDVGLATVGRGIRQAKEAGVLMMTRLGSKLWRYMINYIPKSDHSLLNKKNTKSIISSTNITSCIINRAVMHHSVSSEMSKVSGPEGPMKEAATSVFSSSKFGRTDQTKYTAKPPRKRKTKSKSVADYNTNDVWRVFQETFTEHGFRGCRRRMAVGDTNRLKKLIRDFGAEDVLSGINYMFDNWQTLRTTYPRLGNAPSIGAFCGYADTFIGNALNVAPTDTKKRTEWSGSTEGDTSSEVSPEDKGATLKSKPVPILPSVELQLEANRLIRRKAEDERTRRLREIVQSNLSNKRSGRF